MNKEEIEKAKEEAYWKGYVQKQKEAGEICKMCKYRKKYKELEQKESILDKVTDKLNKNQASDYQVLTKTEYRLRKMNRKEYDTKGNGRYLSDLRDTLLNRIEYQQEILNIIEGEREYCCTCGVELNSENKALNNMCNECKYGLDYQKEREEK